MKFQALIKLSEGKKTVQLDLPVTIGLGEDAQVVVNSEEFKDKSLFLIPAGEYAILVNDLGERIPLSSLSKYGIKVLGVLEKGKEGIVNKMLALEKQAVSNFSEDAKDILFFKKTSLYRYICYGLAVALVGGSTLLPSKPQIIVTKDLSDTQYELISGVKDGRIFGNTKKFNLNPRGVNFKLNLKKGKTGQVIPGSLGFLTVGLDRPNEIDVLVNGKNIYSTKVEKDCFKKPCLKNIKIPTSKLKVGENQIQFVHNNLDSSYLIGKVNFRPLEELDEALERRVNLYFAESNNLFKKRGFGVINLIKGKELISKIEKVGEKYYLPIDIETKTNSLKQRINESINEYTEDFWFLIEKKLSIGQYNSALDELNEMAKYFPDSSTEQGKKVIHYIRKINTALGR